MADYIPFWDDDDPEVAEIWDRVVIGGNVLPGVAKVKCPTQRQIDGKASPGSDGATFTDKGKELAKVTITLQIHTLAEWMVWLTVRPELDPQKAGGLKRPLTIEHPKTALAGVNSVYVTSIEEDDPDSKNGMNINIQCIEWMKHAKPTNSKTDATKSLEEEWGALVSSETGVDEWTQAAGQTAGQAAGQVMDLVTNTFG